MRKFFPIYLILMIAMAACISRPDYVLDEDTMVSLLTDVHMSEGLIENSQVINSVGTTEQRKKDIMAAVLIKHGVTRAQYDSSLVWYGQNLENLVKVYSKINKNLDEQERYWTNLQEESNNLFAVSEAGDSVQLWSITDFVKFDESKMLQSKIWSIKSDSNYVAGDSIILKIHIPYIPRGHYFVASLALNNKSETIDEVMCSSQTFITEEKTVLLSCRGDSTRLFDYMTATLSLLKDSVNARDCVAFADSLSLIRIHKN